MSEDEQKAERWRVAEDYFEKKKEFQCIGSKLAHFFTAVKSVPINFGRAKPTNIEVHGNVVHAGREQVAWIDLADMNALSRRFEELRVRLDLLEDDIRRNGPVGILD